MSYTTSQVEQANKECRHLHGREGEGTKIGDRWVINPNYGGNADCEKKSEPNTAGPNNPLIPLAVVYGIGAIILYYMAKKNKWI